MNSFLPNMRWLCLPSENLGADWFDRSQEIDQLLSDLGMDLAEETTFLLFSKGPEDVLEGKGQCLVARSVIGAVREVQAPLALLDWTAAPVWQKPLQGKTLSELLSESQEFVREVGDQRKLAPDFILSIRRRLLGPELNIMVESLFHE